MKGVRVYMYVDINVDDESEVAETIERILTEGEPFVGEGGIEITSHEVLYEEPDEDEDMEPVPSKADSPWAHVTTEQLQEFCDSHSYDYMHTDDTRILRMRLIMAIREYGVTDLLLDHYPTKDE
ncbi:hypothetical protein D3C77_373010 [compost metagenome]